MFDRHLSCLVYWRLQRMCDDVHIRSDGRLIYNRQDGCVDTSYFNCKGPVYKPLTLAPVYLVYSILSKESVDCFNIQLHPISPPLSPSTSVETSVSQVDISKVQNKPKKLPITQKVAPPRSRKPQNGSKK